LFCDSDPIYIRLWFLRRLAPVEMTKRNFSAFTDGDPAQLACI
jgi:hypothetical protein